MSLVTVVEALAEFPQIDQRIQKKQQLIETYLLRDAARRDPLESEGGTAAVLARELESVRQLQERKVQLRRLIQAANQQATISAGGETRTLADWLVWKREVLARRTVFLRQLRSKIDLARRESLQLARSTLATGSQLGDLVVHLDEKELQQQSEALEELEGYLAGQLTLKNATVSLETPGESWKTGLEERLEKLLQRAGTVPSPLPAPGKHQVILNGFGTDKIMVIKVVREATGLGLKEAKDLVEAIPRVVKTDLSLVEAEHLRQRLEQVESRRWLLRLDSTQTNQYLCCPHSQHQVGKHNDGVVHRVRQDRCQQ